MKLNLLLGLICIFSLTILFHLLVLIKVIPYKMVWGGRLNSDSEMFKFEFISLFINLFFIGIILVKAKIIELSVPDIILKSMLWIMFGLFCLNTVGNLLSKNKLEKLIFTPLTILLAILLLIILL